VTATLLDRDISGAKNSFQHFSITVPVGATSLDVVLSGDRGDADLYVRQGNNRPTANLWNCRPYTNGSNEVCSMPNPTAGRWYVSVAGYTSYSGAHLSAIAR
jgi:serine protease